jgi:hypothetical protein
MGHRLIHAFGVPPRRLTELGGARAPDRVGQRLRARRSREQQAPGPCSRKRFWYWIGLIAVAGSKSWCNAEGLMWTRLASRSICSTRRTRPPLEKSDELTP